MTDEAKNEQGQTGLPGMTLEEKIEWLAMKTRQVMNPGKSAAIDEATGEAVTGMAFIKDRAKRMKELGVAYDVLKPVLDEINAEYDAIRKKTLPDAMSEEDVRSITLDGVGRVGLTGDCYASIPAEQRDTAFAWLRGNNYGSLISEVINASTLKAWAKEMLEQGRVSTGEEEGEEEGEDTATDAAAASLGIEQEKKEEGPAKLPVGVFKIEPFTRATITKVKKGG